MPVITPEIVANMALDLLTEGPIDSLDEDTKPARLLSRHYEVVREAELMKNLWAFALIFPDDIPAATSHGTGAFQYFYELPGDFLRLAWLTEDGTPDGVPLPYTLWGDGLRTRFAGPVKLPYVGNATDPADWDALFTQAFAAALALPLAHALTGKASLIEHVRVTYERAVAEARRLNHIMRLGQGPERQWTVQRGDPRYWRA